MPEPRVSFTPASPTSPETKVQTKTESVPRPARPQRRISEKVLKDTKNLRSELEGMSRQLSGEEAARQRELLVVNFAMNRILTVQQNQMEVQMKLVDRFNEMEIKSVDHVVSEESSSGENLSPKHHQDHVEAPHDERGHRECPGKTHDNDANRSYARPRRSDCKQQ